MLFKYPYTNFNESNLDWLLKKMGELEPAVSMVQDALPLLTEARETAAEAALLAETAQATVDTVLDDAQSAQTVAQNANAVAQVANTNAATALERVEYSKTVAESAAESAASAVETANNASTLASAAQSNSALAVQTATTANGVATAALNRGSWKYAGTMVYTTALALPSDPSGATWNELLLIHYLDGAPAAERITAVIPNINKVADFPSAAVYSPYTIQISGVGPVSVDFTANTIQYTYINAETTERFVVLYR